MGAQASEFKRVKEAAMTRAVDRSPKQVGAQPGVSGSLALAACCGPRDVSSVQLTSRGRGEGGGGQECG